MLKISSCILIVVLLSLSFGVVPCSAQDISGSDPIGIKQNTGQETDAQVDGLDSAGADAFDNGYPDSEEEGDIDKIADPLEPLNRVFFHFNDKLYFWLLKPVAQGYSYIVPEGARISMKNVFNNISTPVRLVNNLLQLKIREAGNELLRFGINSTFGMLGLYDVARGEMGISMQDEDFGQTLGVWGFGAGIYINWPVLGPSSLRDSIGYGGDYFLDPLNYIKPSIGRMAVRAGEGINRTSLSIGDYEEVKQDALDPYSAIRDVYYQYRKSRIDR